jgi:general secretion pathway protein L
LRQLADGFSRWISCVAAAIVALRGWFSPSRVVQLVELTAGEFSVRSTEKRDAGRSEIGRVRISDGKVAGPVPTLLANRVKASRAEIVLQSDHFVFRQLELPRRASDFLAGIVRSQIDRLTPWSANEAAFGFSSPADGGSDRIVVTVAATARALVSPLAEAIAGLGADSIVITTPSPGREAANSIKVFEQTIRGVLEERRVRRLLFAVLLIAVLLAGGSVTAALVVGSDLEAQRIEVASRLAARRLAIRSGDTTRDAGLGALERRKHETPATVIVLEALSRVLPDHTYVTELRITGDKMQVVGITKDAPSLIRLIEQSPHFTRAMFFAPTTRSPSEPGEHFHIEARVEPVFSPGT